MVTLHRPSNVDDPAQLVKFIELFEGMSRFTPRIIFPVHPRTRKQLEAFGLMGRVQANAQLSLVDPVGYLEFLSLQDSAALVLTDSGGVQEETTALNVPCITLRENTERPATITETRITRTNQWSGTPTNWSTR